MIILSIRPIDLKMAFPKTQELSKVEQNNQENLKFSLANQVNEQNKTIKQQLSQVNDSEELSKSKVRDEEDKDNDTNKKDQREEPQTPESELLGHTNNKGNVGTSPNIGGGIDIKV